MILYLAGQNGNPDAEQMFESSCTGGVTGGTNPPQQIPCYDDFGKVQGVLLGLVSTVFDQFANDSRLSQQQKGALWGVLSDAMSVEVNAIAQYMQQSV